MNYRGGENKRKIERGNFDGTTKKKKEEKKKKKRRNYTFQQISASYADNDLVWFPVKERDRQTDRQRQTDRKTDRQTDRETQKKEKKKDTHTQKLFFILSSALSYV